MRTFFLHRKEDVTGISGTGIVAEGVEFSNGKVVIQWIVGDHQSTVVWESIEAVEVIHGHGGATQIVFTEDVVEFWDHDGNKYRSAESGQYVTEEFAELNPDTTVKES